MVNDAPQPFFGRIQKVRSARKDHTCAWCNTTIHKGEPYEKIVFMTDEDDKPKVSKHHLICSSSSVYTGI